MNLPSILTINDERDHSKDILRCPADTVEFPLKQEDLHVIDLLTQVFRQEPEAVGLAAPQIGFSKRIIIFKAPDEPWLKQWRPDLTQFFPETLWFNPSYCGVGVAKCKGGEACFSVNDTAAEVERFQKIYYEAYTIEGLKVEGYAEGFSARVIQHEIDHINGILFRDLVPEEQWMTREEYAKMRKEQKELVESNAVKS